MRKQKPNRQVKKAELKNSLRFLPALAITVFASLLWLQPGLFAAQSNSNVLAYATNISSAGLLSATNSQRSANGAGSLSLNSLLSSAAQAKANDMVARNYWSHQTPDGQQPWVFIANAGYQYTAAGENLAYGFMTSSATVTGWMNSPSHRSNMLDTNFTEVGFGYANSANFVNNGEQTVVVAMYAKPQNAAPAPTPAPAVQSQPTTKKTTPAPTAAPAAEPQQTAPTEQPAETPAEEPAEDKEEEPIAVNNIDDDNLPTASGTSQDVKKVHILTGGSAMWSATFIVLSVCSIGVLWFIRRGYHIGKLIRSGEHFIHGHIHLDLTVLAVVYLGFVMLSSSGMIR